MEKPVYYSPEINTAFHTMFKIAADNRNEFATPEHFLLALMTQADFRDMLIACRADVNGLSASLNQYISSLDKLPEGSAPTSASSVQLRQMIETAANAVICSGKDVLEIPHAVKGLLALEDSLASYLLLASVDGEEGMLMSELVEYYQLIDDANGFPGDSNDNDFPLPDNDGKQWMSFVVCVNDILSQHNPLIGRDAELENTIRILCRKDKNNVLHIGEPGVGKTALVYGLAKKINDKDVPSSLADARIYQLDLGSLLAGTQYRGDFEKRVKMIMDGVSRETNPIVYIDEIHALVGAGATGDSAMDASNMLKPYLEAGKIRFIGSTTYDEYKRHFAKSKGLVRRFRQIDISEPSVDETITIIKRLKKNYENFHGVYYSDKAIEFAVKESVRHISDRFLPDKAIDLIDEAGAARKMHPLKQKRQTVDVALVADVLSKICKVESLSVDNDNILNLETLSSRISARIFGQDEAVRLVTESVQMAKAGLIEDSKPLASLLFVGPTGVGKTEVARVLAEELGIPLVRFDMSEFAEKHAVAKLIGSPAGYVGYEDGGQLTDAIRKTPNCVLLLDEIEKAHPDIYNILLQVMDYANLTDNKGNRADFRNVVLIMTSNAGAQYASQAKVGFGNSTGSGEAMMRQVKKTFKPEFINRLSATVIFNDMTAAMASMILDKKLNMLRKQLSNRNVTLHLSEQALNHILEKGFTATYGARELDRVIASALKPLLMREILFGSLKKGGNAEIDYKDNKLILL